MVNQWYRSTYSDLNDFWQNWDRLNRLYNDAHPMLDSRFVRPLIKHFPAKLEVLSCQQAGKIIALLLVQNKGRGVVSVFAPSQAQISLCLVPEKLDIKSLLSALRLQNLRLDCWFVDPLFQQSILGCGSFSSRKLASINMDIKINGTFEAYWSERSKNLRKGLKRYLNKIEEQFDDFQFKVIDQPEAIAASVEDYGRLESLGWKSETGTSIHPDNTQGHFYKAMMEDFAARDNAIVFEIRLGKRLVASRLCIFNEDCLIILKTTFDETLKEYAFGRVLLYKALCYLFESKITRRVDFYTNATQDQLRWATDQRAQYHVSHYHGLIGRSCLQPLDKLKSGQASSKVKSSCVDVEFCYSINQLGDQERELFKAASTPFTSLDWVENFAENVACKLGKVVFISLKIGGRTEAILPLIEKKQGRMKILSCFSNYYTPYIGLICEYGKSSDYFDLIIEFTKDYLSRFDQLDILPILPGQLDVISQALKRSGFIEERYAFSKNWRELGIQSYEQFISKISGSLRSTIRRKSKKLAAEPGFEVVKISHDNAEQLIADYQRVYDKSWKINEPFPDFIEQLVRRGIGSGCSRLYVMYQEGHPVAAQFWLVDRHRAYIYKLAYDPQYSHLSVGTVLSDYIFRDVILTDGVDEIDYLVGNDRYKSDWMSDCRSLYGICAYNKKSLAGWFFILRKVIKELTIARWQKTEGLRAEQE